MYRYPEGRARIEPVGVIIFATIMYVLSPFEAPWVRVSTKIAREPLNFCVCLDRFMSSLQILVEALRVVQNGPTVELEIASASQAVLGVTIASKLALYLYCRAVLAAVGDCGPVEVYMQDHLNDMVRDIL